VGTHWFNGIFSALATELQLKYQYCEQKDLESDTDLYLDDHSEVNYSLLGPHVASHMIRDPRDIIVSGYFYHLWCTEAWCTTPRRQYAGKSYQQVLKELPQNHGLMFELEHAGATIKPMHSWNYGNPSVIEIRYEDLIANEDSGFARIFSHYGFTERKHEIAMAVVKQCSFSSVSGRSLGEENRASHMRKGLPGDWRHHFTAEHKARFKELFPGTLAKLEYEADDSW
jgi:hypothetical protein